MTKAIKIGLLIVALALVWTIPSFAAHHAVKVATSDSLGSYLTDTEGMTLYWFKKDSPGKSACSGFCVKNWPIFYRETIAPKNGLKAEDFGTITRDDGEKQTTYKGYPLYYWKNDKKAGDTTGHGVKDVWFVIDPSNFPAM